ncbi:hypothetical protein F5Y16DRAFT_278244 [Xylariaceae sp. FL0255]|nr:hypothetical protein F5Y16DRAFT_278244 [Xylariaceae sp. FL0255]
MPTTRSADKGEAVHSQNGEGQHLGSKHDIREKPISESKRAKTDDNKKQLTIEDRIPSPTEAYGNGHGPRKSSDEANGSKPKNDSGDDRSQVNANKKDTAEEASARQGTVPSNILEKGLIYFFFRGRVGIEEPSEVNEIQRSYMLLRPLDKDAKLGEGTIKDVGNTRLIAVPKKVFPQSGRDRWLAFVEKSSVSFSTLKDEFLSATDYMTKTVGARHSPAATPAAEGVYVITTTGRESHLAYVITLPSSLGEVQTELGLKEKGSFVLSTRNPQTSAPQGTALPESADYPQEIQDDFRSRRWMPTEPKHLDYTNTQFLLIGESSGIEKATEPQKEDEEQGKEKPEDELEKLEDEDTNRMQDLKGDESDSIFADLHVRAKDYPKLQTTF